MHIGKSVAVIASILSLAGIVGLLALIGQGGCNKNDEEVIFPGTTSKTANSTTRTAIPTFKPTTLPAAADPTAMDFKGPVTADNISAKIIQTLVGFNHPQAVAISLDGKFLYVTNSAATGPTGMLLGAGSISKLAIGADGRLTMITRELTTGLTCPTGIAVSTKETKKFPAGTLFVSTGMTWGCDENGNAITELAKFKPGVSVIDPQSGQIMAHIPMGPKTAVAASLFHNVVAPNGLTFDPEGHLYICDSGNTGQYLDPPIGNRPGILRIRLKDIDEYSENAGRGDVNFMPVRFVPVAVFDSPYDKGLYWACAGEGPAGGSVWHMERRDYPQANTFKNVIGDIGPLTGLGITPSKALYMSRQDGDIAYITPRKIDSLRFATEEQPVFSTPGNFRLLILKNGQVINYLPEQEPGPIDWKQRLRVIVMPATE